MTRPGRLLLLLPLLALLGCATPPPVEDPTPAPGAARGLRAGVFIRRSPEPAKGWAILLPGSSGLRVFDDQTHYFTAAERLAARGFDVLLVDYKRVWERSAERPSLPTGGKIAWAAEEAIRDARRAGIIRDGEPGVAIAWSLGAEGVWTLFADRSRMDDLGLRAAACYYPSNRDDRRIHLAGPVLILAAEKDDAAPIKDISGKIDAIRDSDLTLRTYPGARHGFDIASLTEPRTVSLIPVIGPSATFQYDATAAAQAWDELAAFLDAAVPR